MRETLFVIPREWFTTWIIGAWLLGGLILLAWRSQRPGWSEFWREFLPVYIGGGALLYFLFPQLSVPQVNPLNPVGDLVPGGLAIRGYGVFLMLAILLSIGLVVRRCRQEGWAVEPVITLCLVMIVSGLVGARLFYVIQKWEDFRGSSPGQLMGEIVDMTKGGLVVYGSLIGGLMGAGVFMFRRRMPIGRTLDMLAPAMVLGLAIGRLGCFMNGCCYGGVCEEDFRWGVRFPVGSPPYLRQWEEGSLLGLRTKPTSEPGVREFLEWAQPLPEVKQWNLQPGERLALPIEIDPQRLRYLLQNQVAAPWPVRVYRLDHPELSPAELPLSHLPAAARPVHPTQLYAALNAGLICGLLWFAYPFRRFPGQIFSGLLILYAVSRFWEEAIRTDELGIWGTQLSISQWISLASVVAGFASYLLFQACSPRDFRSDSA